MAKPRSFSFSLASGDPVRLATAMRDILAALDPLTDAEAADVLRELGKMFEVPSPLVGRRLPPEAKERRRG